MKRQTLSSTPHSALVAIAAQNQSEIASELASNTKLSLLHLSSAVSSFDPEDKDGFSAIIIYANVCGLSFSELAEICGVTRATVSRWAANETHPIKMMRKAVIGEISSWVTKTLKDIDGCVFDLDDRNATRVN